MGRAETELDRLRLAACVRVLHMEGLLTYNGHVSVRASPGDRFLIHSLLDSRAEVLPENLLLLGFDGEVVEAAGARKPPSEYPIHAEIYRARADVGAIAHIHSEYAIAFTLAKDAKVLAMRCDGARWAGGVPVHADPTRIRSAQQGRELAETLGERDAVLLRAHGAVLAAAGLFEVFMACIHLEENARAQVLAGRLGQPLPLTEEEIAGLEESWPDAFRSHYAAKIWRYFVHKAVRADLIPEAWSEKLL